MTNVEKFNDQNSREEIANAFTHGLAAALSVAATVILVALAARGGKLVNIVAASIYGASLIILYSVSTLYHSITNRKAKKVLQTLDHCSIFLLILGSYTPICLVLLEPKTGWTLFGINAFLTVTGIVLNAIDVKRFHKLSLAAYLLMGWSVVFAIRPLMAAITVSGFLLLLAGGLCYTVGVLFYRAKSPRYMHAVWHLFVLAGSVFHYFFMVFFLFL